MAQQAKWLRHYENIDSLNELFLYTHNANNVITVFRKLTVDESNFVKVDLGKLFLDSLRAQL